MEHLDYILLALGLFLAYKLFIEKESMENVDRPEQATEEPTKGPLLQDKPTVRFMPSVDGVKLSPAIDDAVMRQPEKLDAANLLPRYDEANEFSKENPVSKLLQEQNFLVAGYHTGVNTVLQSNKIPYHDLRSAPPIAKEEVGPWMQSSYEQPAGGPGSRRFFEVGQW